MPPLYLCARPIEEVRERLDPCAQGEVVEPHVPERLGVVRVSRREESLGAGKAREQIGRLVVGYHTIAPPMDDGHGQATRDTAQGVAPAVERDRLGLLHDEHGGPSA